MNTLSTFGQRAKDTLFYEVKPKGKNLLIAGAWEVTSTHDSRVSIGGAMTSMDNAFSQMQHEGKNLGLNPKHLLSLARYLKQHGYEWERVTPCWVTSPSGEEVELYLTMLSGSPVIVGVGEDTRIVGVAGGLDYGEVDREWEL